MEFEWDVAKAESNLRKHGVAFDIVRRFEWERAAIVDDLRFEYGEARYIAYGRARDGERYVIAFTLRETVYRIISVRRFGRRERQVYGDAE